MAKGPFSDFEDPFGTDRDQVRHITKFDKVFRAHFLFGTFGGSVFLAAETFGFLSTIGMVSGTAMTGGALAAWAKHMDVVDEKTAMEIIQTIETFTFGFIVAVALSLAVRQVILWNHKTK